MKFSPGLSETVPLAKLTRRCHEYQHLQAETFLKHFKTVFFNISSDLTIEEMIELTGSSDCVGSGNLNSYLQWNKMKWSFKGEIHQYNLSSDELCETSDSKSTDLFFPSIFTFLPSNLKFPYQMVSLT